MLGLRKWIGRIRDAWDLASIEELSAEARGAIPESPRTRKEIVLGRASHTIIFLGADRTDRLDLGPGPAFKVLGQIHLAATDTDEPTARLEKVLTQVKGAKRGISGPGGKIGRRVWVLWERAGTQALDISAGVVDGLDRQQLHDSLSFEAEPLTGLPAADSAIDGIHQLTDGEDAGGFRRFWITQVPASVLTDWQELLTPLGARLAGVAHPGGLPRERWSESAHPAAVVRSKPALALARELTNGAGGESMGVSSRNLAEDAEGHSAAIGLAERAFDLGDDDDEPAISRGLGHGKWRRLEVWEEVTIVLDGHADGTVDTRLVRARPGSERWPEDLAIENPISWLGPIPSSRIGPDGQTIAVRSRDGTPLAPRRIEFPRNGVPIDWMRAWASELTAKPRRLPVVEPRSNISPNLKFYLAGGVTTSIVLAAVIAHALLLSNRIDALKARADQLETTRAQFAPKADPRATQHEAELNDQIGQLQPTVDDLTQQESTLRTQVEEAEKRAADAATRDARLAKLRAAHRPAIPLLVAALNNAEQHENPVDLVFKEIRQDNSGVLLLTGLCRDSGLADRFATKLSAELSPAGWQVGAAQKRLRDDGIGFDFTIAITPGVLSGVPLPALAEGQNQQPTTAPAKPEVDLGALRSALGGH